MRLISDCCAYILFAIGLCPFINSLGVHLKDHTPGITNQFKYVEKYQLLGGNLTPPDFRARKLFAVGKLHSAYVCNYNEIAFPGLLRFIKHLQCKNPALLVHVNAIFY